MISTAYSSCFVLFFTTPEKCKSHSYGSYKNRLWPDLAQGELFNNSWHIAEIIRSEIQPKGNIKSPKKQTELGQWGGGRDGNAD